MTMTQALWSSLKGMDSIRQPYSWIVFMNSWQRSSGFTLLEVMVALTVFVAIALTLSQTASQSVDTTLYLQEKTLASMVAENKLNTLRLEGMPAVGERNETTRLADRQWRLPTKVEKTEFPEQAPHLTFRRHARRWRA